MTDHLQKLPSAIYQRYVDCGTITMDPAQFQAIKKLDVLKQQLLQRQQSVSWFDRLKSTLSGNKAQPLQGFYLWGGVGTGKTLIMDIFFSSLPGHLATRTHFHRFMGSIHTRKKELGEVQNPLAIIARQYATRSKLLCLDEFTVSDITDAMIMAGLVTHLFKQGVVLVTTSNTAVQDLYKDGLQRSRFLPAIELLKKHTRSINVDSGNDYRMAYLQDNDIFLVPDNRQNHAALKLAFVRLSGANEQSEKTDPGLNQASKPPCTIEINGRHIDMEKRGCGIIWFAFDSICRTHRSNSDFIDIARRFHTVIVSSIPVLRHTDDDAARRFIELIDELYDRNVNFLASSEQLPAKIYAGHRLKEPFKRTASRLTEMGSHEYLSKPHLS